MPYSRVSYLLTLRNACYHIKFYICSGKRLWCPFPILFYYSRILEQCWLKHCTQSEVKGTRIHVSNSFIVYQFIVCPLVWARTLPLSVTPWVLKLKIVPDTVEALATHLKSEINEWIGGWIDQSGSHGIVLNRKTSALVLASPSISIFKKAHVCTECKI